MEQYSVIHDNNESNSSESTSIRSMMSISEIANMLENMTCTSPRDLFDNLMKQGECIVICNSTYKINLINSDFSNTFFYVL